MGTPDFSVPVLESLIASELYEVVLVVTQPDRPKGRKRVLTASPVKDAAVKHDIPVFQPEKLSEAYEEIFSYEADLIVTAAYGQLLPNELLEHPAYGSINVHASLLPELRGGAPIHYAILQGKAETGITIMYMVEKLDAGNIISQGKLPILDDDHVGTLHEKLAVIGAELLLETLPDIFNRTNASVVQDESKATFAGNITREQEEIDWNQSNEVVYNQIRGLHPWPVAYSSLDEERMKIWWARLDETVYKNKQPGEIVAILEDSFIVMGNNEHGIQVTDIQLSGKKRMDVSEFIRGNPGKIQVGQVLK